MTVHKCEILKNEISKTFNSLSHSFIQWVFTECLLCARHSDIQRQKLVKTGHLLRISIILDLSWEEDELCKMIHVLQQAAIQSTLKSLLSCLFKNKWQQPTSNAFLIPDLELTKYPHVPFFHDKWFMKLSVRKAPQDLLLKTCKSYKL